MSSVASILSGTPAKLQSALAPAGGGAGVESLNDATGALTLAAGEGVTIETAGTTLTVGLTGGAAAQIGFQSFLAGDANLKDLFQGGSFLPVASIPVPEEYQNATLYRVTFRIAGQYIATLNGQGPLSAVAAGTATIPGLQALSNSSLGLVSAGDLVNLSPVDCRGTVAYYPDAVGGTANPTTFVYLFLAADTGVVPDVGQLAAGTWIVNGVLECIN